LEQTFGHLIKDLKELKTVRPKPGDTVISPEDQKLYWSRVGMLW
jgi:hypothetical protein